MSFNYPYYNPYMPPAPGPNGFQQPRPEQMMQGYPQMQQSPPAAPQSQMQGFSVRPVTNREEAVAAQIDFLSPGTLMPDFGNGKVYFKRFNGQTGACDFLTFSLAHPEQAEETQSRPESVEYATKEDLQEMRQVVQGLAGDIERLRQPVRGGKRLESDA